MSVFMFVYFRLDRIDGPVASHLRDQYIDKVFAWFVASVSFCIMTSTRGADAPEISEGLVSDPG